MAAGVELPRERIDVAVHAPRREPVVRGYERDFHVPLPGSAPLASRRSGGPSALRGRDGESAYLLREEPPYTEATQ